MADIIWTWTCRDCTREGADLVELEARVAATEHEDEAQHRVLVAAVEGVQVDPRRKTKEEDDGRE